MPPTEPSKHTKRSRTKARGQASRQQACGEREGQSLSHRGTAKQRYALSVWANKALTERGQSIRPKQAKSGQFAKNRACENLSSSRNHVRATNCPRPPAEQRSVFGGRSEVQRISMSIVQGTKIRGRVGGQPLHTREPPAPS